MNQKIKNGTDTILEKGGGTEGPEACLNDYIGPMTQGGGAHVIKPLVA